MKNLKTKIGMSLAALTCVLTLNATTINADTRDSDVMKVVETLKDLNQNLPRRGYRYKLTVERDRYVEFWVCDNVLAVELYDQHSWEKEFKRLTIIDYNLNNLDSTDIVIYEEPCTNEMWPPYSGKTMLKFGELSEQTQKKLKEKYSWIIKEAPEKLLERQKILKNGFENDVLKMIEEE